MLILIFALSFLSVDIPFSANVEKELFLTQELVFENPTSWSEWKKDPVRMSWWSEHGWKLLEGVKQGALQPLMHNEIIVDQIGFSPLQLNLEPDQNKHKTWSIENEKTLILYSVVRCEELYQRFLINQAAQKSLK